jgi:hypothetical protein
VLCALAPAVASASTISGTAYEDLNRDAAHTFDEPVLSDQTIYLFDASGRGIAAAYTDGAGVYGFGDLPDGEYRIAYAANSWWPLRGAWVPTTTGSLRPSISLRLSGAATADFGWRPIVRSSDPLAPMSSYVGPSGLRVSSYDDVVRAQEIHDALAGARIGAEAPYTEVRFDLGAGSMTNTAAGSNGGTYTSFSAISYVDYVSWLDSGDRTLTHEYGHAWSLYHAYMVQQDPTLASYLDARRLAGDARVNSSYAWQAREMIAEDYRQVFGSANARSGQQINTEIPPANEVSGLAGFLATTFTTPSASPSPTPMPSPTPAPEPTTSPAPTATSTPTPLPTPSAPQVDGLAMTPDPVRTTGTAAFSLSAPASVSVRILTSKGALVRTLLSAAPTPPGAVSVTWNRKDSAGRKVGKGSYRVQVDATDGDGVRTSVSASFTVVA